jgi:rubrerythrin
MLSKEPIKLVKVGLEFWDREIARLGMIAELDATSLYEQLAESTEDEQLKRVLLDVAKEEKTHFGEFETVLLKKDPEQVTELQRGREEVEGHPTLREEKTSGVSKPECWESAKSALYALLETEAGAIFAGHQCRFHNDKASCENMGRSEKELAEYVNRFIKKLQTCSGA